MNNRIKNIFNKLKQKNEKAFIPFVVGGDPDYEVSFEILKTLAEKGADIIEIGIPFLDPSGDGPIIEQASHRAIKAGMNLNKVFDIVKRFRKIDKETAIILMGYYNPVFVYGDKKFIDDAFNCGVDGVLIVDLPMEENDKLINHANKAGINFINLIAPTTSKERAKKILQKSHGFVYLVAILGITGTKDANFSKIKEMSDMVRDIKDIPIVTGFGIKNEKQIKKFTEFDCDGIVVGSRLVEEIAIGLQKNYSSHDIVKNIGQLVDNFKKITKL